MAKYNQSTTRKSRRGEYPDDFAREWAELYFKHLKDNPDFSFIEIAPGVNLNMGGPWGQLFEVLETALGPTEEEIRESVNAGEASNPNDARARLREQKDPIIKECKQEAERLFLKNLPYAVFRMVHDLVREVAKESLKEHSATDEAIQQRMENQLLLFDNAARLADILPPLGAPGKTASQRAEEKETFLRRCRECTQGWDTTARGAKTKVACRYYQRNDGQKALVELKRIMKGHNVTWEDIFE